MDMRTFEDVTFISFRETIPRHFGELLTMARIANKEIFVSLHLIHLSCAQTVFSNVPLHRDDDELARILDLLDKVRLGKHKPPRVREGYISSTSAVISYIHHICDIESDSANSIIIFASTRIALADMFRNFVDFTLDSPYELHCITVRSDAICIDCSIIGMHRRVYHCPPDPDNIKAALQSILEKPLLGVVPLPVTLKMGNLSLECEAQRVCLSILPRCTTMESYTHIQDYNPELIFQGPRVVHSALEQRRFSNVGEPLPITVHAIMKPQNVEDTYLYGDTWVLSTAKKRVTPSSYPASTNDCSASQFMQVLHELFKEDVLVCSTPFSNFDPPHQMALQRSCFLIYILGRNKLAMRAIMPTEIRRVILIDERPLRQADATLRKQLLDIRNHLKQRGNDPNFLMDRFTQGNLCQIVSQQKTERVSRVENSRVIL
ncbi:unnamed protein product [Phytomonas sp. EM1]|nr:unnamed protein product [Phytomonas sp. EM1]|eukprot:CCW65051.1 unnamed protein product [Phytomonas sp. isolate EM1]